jgi:TRAP-type C4-dicarboxylate transport system substrate-binding protein
MKLRTASTPAEVALLKAYGANPTPIPYAQVYTALQQGVVDGQVNLNTLMMTMKYFEVVKFWVQNEFGLGFDKVVIAQRTWNRFKPEQQKMMQELFLELEARKWYPVLKERLDADQKKWAEINGADSVLMLDAAELRRLTQPTAERLANEILGPGTYKQIQDTA